jgi:hypothetical protein
VDLDDAAPVQGASKVPVYYGIPGVQCKHKPGSRARMGFEAGDERKRYVSFFDPFPPQKSDPEAPPLEFDSPVEEITLVGGTNGAARVDDAADAGTLTWIPSPPAGGIPTGGTLQYHPPAQGGRYPTPVQWVVAGPIALTPDAAAGFTIAITAVIREGSAIVKIG